MLKVHLNFLADVSERLKRLTLDNGKTPDGSEELRNSQVKVSDGELDDVFDKEGHQYQVKSDVGVQGEKQSLKQIHDRGFESREELDEASQEGFMVTFAGERNGAKAGSNLGSIPKKIEPEDVSIGATKTLKDVIGVKPVKRGSALTRLCGLLSGAGIGDAVKQNVLWTHAPYSLSPGAAPYQEFSETATILTDKVAIPYWHDEDNISIELVCQMKTSDAAKSASLRLSVSDSLGEDLVTKTETENSIGYQRHQISINLTGLEFNNALAYWVIIGLKADSAPATAYFRYPIVYLLGK